MEARLVPGPRGGLFHSRCPFVDVRGWPGCGSLLSMARRVARMAQSASLEGSASWDDIRRLALRNAVHGLVI